MEKKMAILIPEKEERSVYKSCVTFLNFLFEKSMVTEQICRK
jgi:hypothetical protein